MEPLFEISPELQADIDAPNEYKLEKFLLKDGKKHPFAIICPGGGYQFVSFYTEGKLVSEYLNEKGFHAFVLRYRKQKLAVFPNPLDDLARGIKEIFDHKDEWNVDVNDYAIFGFSAGGHLAGLFCGHKFIGEKYNLPKPKIVVLSYPVITLGEHTHLITRDLFTGKNKSLIQECSVENVIDENYPKTYIWCDPGDMLVDSINSKMLVEKLNQYHIDYLFETFVGGGHGQGLALDTPAEGWIDHAIKFWQSN